jgi:hypothetical protein
MAAAGFMGIAAAAASGMVKSRVKSHAAKMNDSGKMPKSAERGKGLDETSRLTLSAPPLKLVSG